VKPSVEEIGNLLALKRHERPPEGYMEDFLREFHQRRREEAMGERGFAAWWKRLGERLMAPGAARWAYGAGAAYAAVMITVVLLPRQQEVVSPPTQDVEYREVTPVDTEPVQQLDQLDLRPESEGKTGEQVF
jgi:hypothetical protein